MHEQICELESYLQFLVISTAKDDEVIHPGLHVALLHAYELARVMRKAITNGSCDQIEIGD